VPLKEEIQKKPPISRRRGAALPSLILYIKKMKQQHHETRFEEEDTTMDATTYLPQEIWHFTLLPRIAKSEATYDFVLLNSQKKTSVSLSDFSTFENRCEAVRRSLKSICNLKMVCKDFKEALSGDKNMCFISIIIFRECRFSDLFDIWRILDLQAYNPFYAEDKIYEFVWNKIKKEVVKIIKGDQSSRFGSRDRESLDAFGENYLKTISSRHMPIDSHPGPVTKVMAMQRMNEIRQRLNTNMDLLYQKLVF
jgi:hypothetical protein